MTVTQFMRGQEMMLRTINTCNRRIGVRKHADAKQHPCKFGSHAGSLNPSGGETKTKVQ